MYTWRDHLESVRRWLVAALSTKYEQGQIEHGGQLWLKPGMLAHAEAEAIDLVTYLPTLRQQLISVQTLLTTGHTAEATDLLATILGEATE